MILILQRLNDIENKVDNLQKSLVQNSSWGNQGVNQTAYHAGNPTGNPEANYSTSTKQREPAVNYQRVLQKSQIFLQIYQTPYKWNTRTHILTSLSQLLGYQNRPIDLKEFYYLPKQGYAMRILLTFYNPLIPNKLAQMNSYLQRHGIKATGVFKDLLVHDLITGKEQDPAIRHHKSADSKHTATDLSNLKLKLAEFKSIILSHTPSAKSDLEFQLQTDRSASLRPQSNSKIRRKLSVHYTDFSESDSDSDLKPVTTKEQSKPQTGDISSFTPQYVEPLQSLKKPELQEKQLPSPPSYWAKARMYPLPEKWNPCLPATHILMLMQH